MKTIRCEIEVALPQEDLFDLTQDYDRRLDWDPYLIEAYLLEEAEEAAVGVESFCKNKTGSVMVSRYISYERPKVAAVTMTKGPFVLRKFSGAWNVQPVSASASRLVFTYNFELKWGVIGKLLQPIAVVIFRSDMEKRLKAIKGYVERL